MVEKTKKHMTYIDAMLAFSQCGMWAINSKTAFTRCTITWSGSQYVFGKFKNSMLNNTERNASVVNLQILALVLQKLFRFKRANASRLSLILQSQFHGPKANFVIPKMIGGSCSAKKTDKN